MLEYLEYAETQYSRLNPFWKRFVLALLVPVTYILALMFLFSLASLIIGEFQHPSTYLFLLKLLDVMVLGVIAAFVISWFFTYVLRFPPSSI